MGCYYYSFQIVLVGLFGIGATFGMKCSRPTCLETYVTIKLGV